MNNHLEETGLTYWQHLGRAWQMAARLFGISVIALLHGVFPFWFTRTVSNQIQKLNQDINHDQKL